MVLLARTPTGSEPPTSLGLVLGRRSSLRPAPSIAVQTLKRFNVQAAEKTRLMEPGGYYYCGRLPASAITSH